MIRGSMYTVPGTQRLEAGAGDHAVCCGEAEHVLLCCSDLQASVSLIKDKCLS